MSIRPAPRGCCTTKHIILFEKAWLVVIVIVARVIPPRDLIARFVLPQWEFKHLAGGAAIHPLEIDGVREVGIERFRVRALFLVVGKYDVYIVRHVGGGEDRGPVVYPCGSSACLRV